MHIMNTGNTSGFSLIELMVVIAIVALLAAVSVPSYRSYIGRTNAAEVNSIIGAQLDAFAVATDTNGTLPSGAGLGNWITAYASPSSTTMTFTLGGSGAYVAANLDSALISAAPVIQYTATNTNPYVWTCAVFTDSGLGTGVTTANTPFGGSPGC
jgi:type IV pilus assembly protein PilA